MRKTIKRDVYEKDSRYCRCKYQTQNFDCGINIEWPLSITSSSVKRAGGERKCVHFLPKPDTK